MRNIVGQPVTGEDFFERPDVEKKIRKAMDVSNHILISAPKGSGKTSLLFHLRDNQREDSRFIYINVGVISNEEEYYKRIYRDII